MLVFTANVLRYSNIVCFISLFTFTVAHSQGYLGRKMILKYDALISPALSNPTYNSPVGVFNNQSNYGEDKDEHTFAVNAIHCLAFEYLLDRFSSITLYGGYGRTSILHQIGYQDRNYIARYIYDPYDLNIKLFTNEIGVKYTKYTSNASVGLGSYFSFSYSRMFNVIKERIEIDEVINVQKLHTFNNSMLGAELGIQKIYQDRIVTSFAVVSRLQLKWLFDAIDGGLDPSYSNSDSFNQNNPFQNYQKEMDRLEDNAKMRIILRDFLMMKFSIGFLIF